MTCLAVCLVTLAWLPQGKPDEVVFVGDASGAR